MRDIANDIIAFLFSAGRVDFPGLGSLSINRTGAKINSAKNKLLAPLYYISFDYNAFDDKTFSDFISYLAAKNNISEKKASSLFKKYSLGLLNNIANFGQAEIENLGTFKRRDGKILFEISPLFEEILKESYRDLPLVYIDRKEDMTKNSKNEFSSNSILGGTAKKKTSRDRDWIFPLLILTFIALVFICLVNCLTGIFGGESVVGSDNKNITNTSRNTGVTTHQNEESRKSSDVFKDTVANEENESLPFSDSDSIDNKAENVSGRISNVQNDTTAVIGKMEKISLDELIKMAPELQKAFDKSCIIITGSFVKRHNAARMIKLLVDKGYTPYSERYGRFHRTGVIFDCEKNSLYEFLRILRKDIDKESWVLKWR